jgi:hypothetical protein
VDKLHLHGSSSAGTSQEPQRNMDLAYPYADTFGFFQAEEHHMGTDSSSPCALEGPADKRLWIKETFGNHTDPTIVVFVRVI